MADITPRFARDNSWHIALQLAPWSGLHWGRDLVFTYGPLGFVNDATLVHKPLAIIALFFTAIVQVLWCGTLFTALRRCMSWPLAAISSYVVARICLLEPIDLLVLVLFVWLAWGVSETLPVPAGRWVAPIGGTVAGLALLVKFNAGVGSLALVSLAAPFLWPRRMRGVAVVLGSASFAVVAGWLVAGQHLGDLPNWLRRTAEVALGYSAAMAEYNPAQRKFLIAAAVLTLLFAATFLVSVEASRSRRIALAALALTLGLLEFKQAFVRSHVRGLLVAALLIAVVLPRRPGRLRAFPQVAAALTAAAMLVYAVPHPQTFWTPVDALPRQAFEELRLILDPTHRQEMDTEARRNISHRLGLSREQLAQVGDATVHIDPFETSAIFAFTLHWQPVPVFQSYSAYTPLLDNLDAAALSGSRAPQRILRQRRVSTDNRFQVFESPAYMLAMMCHYRELSASFAWQVLARETNHCGTAMLLDEVRASPGQRVPVPEPRTVGNLVIARLSLSVSVEERLTALLYRPLRPVEIDLGHARPYRLVVATAGQPLVVRGPDDQHFFPTDETQGLPSMQVRVPGSWTVRFYEVPYTH